MVGDEAANSTVDLGRGMGPISRFCRDVEYRGQGVGWPYNGDRLSGSDVANNHRPDPPQGEEAKR